ncbi:MAG: hypothetical protein ACRDSR_25425 [Pseudonocardiaceae bacterium]
MFDAVSFAEVDGQHVELLPARTVMSVFSLDTGGNGGDGTGGAGANLLAGLGILAPGTASAGNGTGGAGGAVTAAPPAP